MHSSVRHSSDEGVLGEATEQEQQSLATDKLSFLASEAAAEDVIFIWLLLIDFASVDSMATNIITHKNKEIL